MSVKPSANLSFAVLGAGAWGTALAVLLANNGYRTILWGHDAAEVEVLRQARCNEKYLPGAASLPQALSITADLQQALGETEAVLVVTPSHAFREVITHARAHIQRHRRLVWATKGLELESGLLLHQVAEQIVGVEVQKAVISGPNFAGEVARQIPSATTVAGDSLIFANEIASCLHNRWFRAYSSEDLVGVQLGGALKNGLAIAAGIADGLGFGANTRAALLTRGLHEITQLGMALGGQMATFLGLAGVGDLILSCTDNQSRNRRLGLLLGQGRSLTDAAAELGLLTEGIKSVQVALRLAQQCGCEIPILQEVQQVLFAGKAPRAAVEALFMREQKPE